MQLCRIIYYSLTALHVSSDIFAHHQEYLNSIYSFRYYTRMLLPVGIMGVLERRSNTPMTPNGNNIVCNTRSCKYSLDTPDDERKYRSKHVEQPRNNKLSYTAASCWTLSLNYIMMRGTTNIRFINNISVLLPQFAKCYGKCGICHDSFRITSRYTG